jgi:nitroreductase
MDLFETLRAYHPVGRFLPKPIEDEKLRAVLSAARLAPSQNNMQPWRFIVVQDDERKRLLSQACPKGKVLVDAPLVVVALAVEEDIPFTIGGYISVYPLDVAVAVRQMQLAATAQGLGTAWIADFHEDKVRAVLGIPEGIHPLAIVPLGYPAEPSNGNNGRAATPEGRKSINEIVAYNEYAW